MKSSIGHRLCRTGLVIALSVGALQAYASTPVPPPTVDLSAEASRSAPNDLAQATAYVEATDAQPAELSRKVNAAIAAALERIKAYPDIKASTSGISTWPVYARNGQTIEAWRMRSTISLESRNISAMSDLLGELQTDLAVTSVVMQPAPETRASVADLAATDAIRAFEARATSIGETLGKRYRLRHLSINYGGTQGPIHPMMRSGMMAAEASAPAPLEGGESQIVVNISGTIELID